ncbi:MAG: efflux transporter outer membrane subunit [Comamonas sp.]|uniref:efflux transporter outer membrane subunit n=1 Tax=Comamonas TaxID=283 RepID=UPI002648A2EE|nr:efflux transporter outer membrane subunit [Comamonas sp.]MDN5506792.1 efflux transporter outer membrane subunit [Comamonas sp.]MDN5537642.1 efflux transporter outer membrane subunit [Comamonas sp.]
MTQCIAAAAQRIRPRRHGWWVLGLPALLAACAQVPEWEGKALLAQPVPEPLQAASYAPPMDWPTQQWWQRYGDAQLDQLIAQALEGAPDMAAAAARVQQARAMLGVSEAAAAPQLSARASVSEDKLSYNHLTPEAFAPRGMNDYGRATLELSWSLDLWGKQRAAVAAAAGELAAREADAAQARLLLSSNVALAYAQLLRLAANAQTLEQSVQVRHTTADLFEQRYANGLENQGSVHSARARLAAAQAELAQMQEQVALQRNSIAALIGAAPDRGAAIELDAGRLQSPWRQQWALPEQLSANLLGRRPDVVAARLQAQALESRVASQQAEFYPDVNLSAFVGVQSLGLDMLTRSGSGIASVGPAVSLPIFNGGRLRSQLGAARARYDEAVAQYRSTLNRALQEVADNAVSQRALQQQLAAMQQAVTAATEAHRVARNRYEGGLARYLDVLSAEDQLLASVRQLVDVQSRALTLDIGLHRALGGGWSESAAAPDAVSPKA